MFLATSDICSGALWTYHPKKHQYSLDMLEGPVCSEPKLLTLLVEMFADRGCDEKVEIRANYF